MKALNTPTTTALPRSANLSRFRPLSLPVYLDHKAPSKRRVDAPVVELPPHASPKRQSTAVATATAMKQRREPAILSSSFQLSALPRILRPGMRSSLLSKPARTRPPGSPALTPTTPGTPTTTTTPLRTPTQRTNPYAHPHPQSNESRCCQMLIHGLFVAFEDDFVASGVPRAEELRADGGRPFTHILSLSTRHAVPIAHSVDDRKAGGAKRLRLRLPRLYSAIPPTEAELAAKVLRARAEVERRGEVFSDEDYYDIVFDEGEGTGFTGLEALQLLAARDFLYASGLGLGPDGNPNARVLVTTPRDHRTDAIAAVMGYLSLVLGHSVAQIVRTQDAHPKVREIWKYTISDECAAFIEEVCHL